MNVAGIVLCGGRSSRMGTPKAWLPFGGELMLPRVVRILGEAVGPVVVVAAPGQDVPPLPAGVRIVRDDVEGRGPLGGLAAGLAALEGVADAVYLSSCDVPLLTPAFVARVVELLKSPPPRPSSLKGRGRQRGKRPCEPRAPASGLPPPSLQGGGLGGWVASLPCREWATDFTRSRPSTASGCCPLCARCSPPKIFA